MKIEISIPGKPETQQRHRHFSRGKFHGSYDPNVNDKQDFLAIVYNKSPEKPLDQPLGLSVKFYFPRPKNHYGTGKKSTILKSDAPFFHTSKPDADNCIKLITDAMNTVFYRDDSLICALEAVKLYSDTPRTEILIETL
jgi:Holliday junction resolvase RusA-like endonuclease